MFLTDFVKIWQTQFMGKEVGSKSSSNTFTDEDKERQKQQIQTCNPQLEDGFIVIKRDFLPTRDETLGRLQKMMEASDFTGMSSSGFTQYVHFCNLDITLTRPIFQRNWLAASLMKI